MKLQIVGFEITEGISKKTNQPYSIGKLHTVLPLAGNGKEGNVSRGTMGKEFRCEVPLIRKIEHLTPPFFAELETAEVMSFGEMRQDIVSVKPVELVKKVA